MSASARRRELAASERKMLIDKVMVVEDRIRGLELQKKSKDDIPNDSCWTSTKESYVRQNRSGEDIAILQQCFTGSLELLGIHFEDYNQVILPPQPGIPGLCKETTMRMIINEMFTVDINKITCNTTDDSNQIISLQCNVKGRLYRKELSKLTEIMCASNDLTGLTRGLRAYGKLASARSNTLNRLANEYDECFRLKTSDSGITIVWQYNVFHMFWSIQWNDCQECIMDDITIHLYRNEPDFIGASQPIVYNLTNKMTNAKLRTDSLLELAALASRR